MARNSRPKADARSEEPSSKELCCGSTTVWPREKPLQAMQLCQCYNHHQTSSNIMTRIHHITTLMLRHEVSKPKPTPNEPILPQILSSLRIAQTSLAGLEAAATLRSTPSGSPPPERRPWPAGHVGPPAGHQPLRIII